MKSEVERGTKSVKTEARLRRLSKTSIGKALVGSMHHSDLLARLCNCAEYFTEVFKTGTDSWIIGSTFSYNEREDRLFARLWQRSPGTKINRLVRGWEIWGCVDQVIRSNHSA